MPDYDGKFWMVWNEQGNIPMFKHHMRCDAQNEAERLARNNPGQTFHVLESIETLTVDNLRRTMYDRDYDGIPF